MRITPEQRAAWRQATAESPFNKWLDAQVRTPDGTLDLERLHALAREYGIDKRIQYAGLNPGQQRMSIGNLLRRRVPPETYGAPQPTDEELEGDAVEAAAEEPVDLSSDTAERPEIVRASSVRDLLMLHSQIMDELRSRAIVRTSNAPLGDYAELLFGSAFAWDLENNSSSGHDALDLTGVRYQIKARRLTQHNQSRQLSAIRRLPEQTFDVLAAALFNEDYTVRRAALIPHAVVVSLATRREHTNSWRFILHERVWEIEGVKDVTVQLKHAASNF